MSDSKLIILFKALSADELRQCEKFIDSPLYNKGRDLLPFFKVLKNFYPEFNDKNLTNEFIFKKLNPGKKYDPVKSDNLVRTLTSHLYRVCKEFLVYLELEDQTAKKKYLLLNQLRKKKQYKEFDKEFDSIDEAFGNEGKGSIGYFVDRHLISAVKRDCSLNRDDFKNSLEYSFQTSENVSIAALISLFKYEDEKNISSGYEIKLRDNLLEALLKSLDPDKLLTELQRMNFKDYPYIEIFNGFYMMNKYNKDSQHYFKTKELLKKYSDLFGQPENYFMWNMMLTYCGVNKLSSSEVFSVHIHMIESGFYRPLPTENFHIVLFRNIVLEATFNREYEWLENFIEKYSSELHEYHRDNMRIYSMAYLCFAKGEFGKALEHILKIKYNLFMFKIDMKILQLKIYYELSHYEEGLSLVSAALDYLQNSKEVGEMRKTAIGNFVKCIRDLVKVKSGSSNKDELLYKVREMSKANAYRGLTDWILAKVNEIEPA